MLIDANIVSGWDDPRLYTPDALRRCGFPTEAIKEFCAKLGVTSADSAVHPDVTEAEVRDCLNFEAPRTMAVLESLKVVIENFDQIFPSESPTNWRCQIFRPIHSTLRNTKSQPSQLYALSKRRI
jgi:glutamyl/glutaminyl-tRNA synthetase